MRRRLLLASSASVLTSPAMALVPKQKLLLFGKKAPAPSLDLNFLSATLDPSITWTRANATATDGLYTDATGSSFNSFVANAPRISIANGLLIENAAVNYLLNSGTPATQTTASLATGTYSLWVIGTGSATSSAGTATGSGFGAASAGVPNSFTLTVAGTVVVTVAGSLNRFQLEKSLYPTSYIPTVGGAVTRVADSGSLASGSWFNASEGTLVVDFMQRQISANINDLPSLYLDGNNLLVSRLSNSNAQTLTFVANASVGTVPPPISIVSANVAQRYGITYQTVTRTLIAALNGSVSNSIVATSLPAFNSIKFGIARSSALDGLTRRIRYYPKFLSPFALKMVTMS